VDDEVEQLDPDEGGDQAAEPVDQQVAALLRRNMLLYGLGGLIAPFVGIKLIDLVVHNLLGA